ncbi:MAG: isoaspartyl peptidase/L-asparaginase [Calditrichaeota bacterium]|nr:isoaspartyl peptidase/L-asparaginase [Calditrichota bacterium]
MPEVKLIVHGGAWNIPEKHQQDHIDGCRKAAELIYPELNKGMNAVDAVEAAVRLLEEDATFDAGRGAFLNAAGEIELDAIICDGSTLNFGAMAAIHNILHPVSAARLLLNHPEHCFLAGEGAQRFLRDIDFPEVKIEELLTNRELEYYQQIKVDPDFRTKQPFQSHRGGTVGAVALDKTGNLAAATSTGGTPRKLPGRIGDSPVIGSGTYADNQSGAVSATGYGESILKVVLAKQVCDLFLQTSAMEAARKGIEILQTRVNGWGGVIGINKYGEYAFHHNTECMAFARHVPGRGIIAQISHRND